MFIEFTQVLVSTVVKSYVAEHNGSRLEIDVYRRINRDGGDNSSEFICRLNGKKVKTLFSKPGSHHEEKTLDKAKRALVAIYTKETRQ